MSGAPISILWILLIIIVIVIVITILVHVVFLIIAIGPLAYAHEQYIPAEHYNLLKTAIWSSNLLT